MLWKGPIFREWLRTNRPQVSCSVWKRLGKRIDPEYVAQVKKIQVDRSHGGRALQSACPRPLVTKRENAVLEQRMSGKIPKEIAAAEAISESTVRQHLQTIKKTLFTNDLVNAVVIALRSGMLVQDRKEALASMRIPTIIDKE